MAGSTATGRRRRHAEPDPSTTVNGSSMNGVAVDGDNLYVTMTTSLSGRVLKVPWHNQTEPAWQPTSPLRSPASSTI